MFMLLVIEKQKHIDVLGKEVALPLKWADGMIGAIPVFTTRGAAEKYRGDSKAQIFEIVEQK